MKRLFIALEIPAHIKRSLRPLQAATPEPCRRTPEERLHLTLVFLGQADPNLAQNALSGLSTTFPSPQVELDRPGFFRGRNQIFYWAGVRREPKLIALQAEVLAALQAKGLKADTKPYRPHITLARCKPALDSAEPDAFLQQPVPRVSFHPEHFTLFSSETRATGPVYEVEARFAFQRAI